MHSSHTPDKLELAKRLQVSEADLDALLTLAARPKQAARTGRATTRSWRVFTLVAVFAVIAGTGLAWAFTPRPPVSPPVPTTVPVPTTIPYRGEVFFNGEPYESPGVEMRFQLFDASTGGTQLWEETHEAVVVAAGRFSVLLGKFNYLPDAVLAAPELFLQAVVDGNQLVGRQQILSVPYARRSGDGVPVGAILPYYGTTPPAGWLVADGSALDKVASPQLAALVDHLNALAGTTGTTATLPDLRGVFLRGQDRGAGLNPDAGEDSIGMFQESEISSHSHTGSTGSSGNHRHVMDGLRVDALNPPAAGYYGFAVVNSGGGINTLYAGEHTHSITTNTTGGNETRPKNITVLHIIKY